MTPKYQRIAEELKQQIQTGKYANAVSLPSEFDLAEKYQVSRQTIRHVLAILEEDQLIVKKKGSGSFIRRSQPPEAQPHRSVAVVTTYISDYIFPGILREAEQVLAEHNCTPSLYATQNQVSTERKVLRSLLTLSVDGLLVEGTKTALPNPNLDLYRQLMARGVPMVFLNGGYAKLYGTISVLDDNAGGGRMLVDYLVSKGHSKIAGIFKADDIQGLSRYEGYTEGLQGANLSVEDRRTFWYTTERREALFTDGVLEAQLNNWIAEGCTAVVCYNDEIAAPLISRLLALGVRVPEDMAVVSFDNSQLSAYGPVPITSLSHGTANVGRTAAEKLLQLMDGAPVSSQVIPWTLVQRKSG